MLFLFFVFVADVEIGKKALMAADRERDFAGSGSKTKSAAARCAACASPSPKFACSGCREEVYCGERCQKKDWFKHQARCGADVEWLTTEQEGVSNQDKILLNLIFNGERSFWYNTFAPYLGDDLFDSFFNFFGQSSVRRFDFTSLKQDYGPDATLSSVIERIWNEDFPAPEFTLEEELGSGTYGTVYRARDNDTDELYAVKIFKDLESIDIGEIVASEASLMRFVNPIDPLTKERGNDHVIAFFGFWYHDVDGRPILISELVQGSDFQTYFMGEGFEQRTDRWQTLENAIPGIFDGLAYLHSKGIAHRDIKPDNIMLELPSGRPVLIDLGLSCAFGSEEEIAQRLLEKWSCDTGGNNELGGAIAYTWPEMARIYFNNLIARDEYHKEFASIEKQQSNDLWAVGLTVLDCILVSTKTLSFLQLGVQDGDILVSLRSVAHINTYEGLLRIRSLIIHEVPIPASLFERIKLIEDILLRIDDWTAADALRYIQSLY